MSTPIEQNTTDLQNILNAVNELPDAGGTLSELELIYKGELAKDVTAILIDKDLSGNPFSLNRLLFVVIGTATVDSVKRFYYNGDADNHGVELTVRQAGFTNVVEISAPGIFKAEAIVSNAYDRAIVKETEVVNKVTSVGYRNWNGAGSVCAGSKYYLYGVKA